MEVDNSFGPVDVCISGLRAQNRQMEIISSNVANARTTDAGNGQPYRRLEVAFKTEDDALGGVAVDGIVPDMSKFYRIYEPGNPRADGQGYVTMPNVDLPKELINLSLAARTYKANAAILKRYQQMVETALELLK